MFTLENISPHILRTIIESPHLSGVINNVPRGALIDFVNSNSCHIGHIKHIKPVLDKNELSKILDERKKRKALEIYLSKAGSKADFEFACKIDGSFLGKVPNSQRTVSLIKESINSGTLPSFSHIPKKYRSGKHEIFKLYFEKLSTIDADTNAAVLRSVDWTEQIPALIDILEEQCAIQVCKRAFTVIHSSLMVSLFRRPDFFIRNFGEIYNREKLTNIPDFQEIVTYDMDGSANAWVTISEKFRIPLSYHYRQYSTIQFYRVKEAGGNPHIKHIDDFAEKYQSWFNLNDAFVLQEQLEKNKIKTSAYPQLDKFRAELDLLKI